jgi:ATP-dependent DNA ligase
MGSKKLRDCYEHLEEQPPEDRLTIVAYAKDKAAKEPDKWLGVTFENAAVVPAPVVSQRDVQEYAERQAARMPKPQLCHTLELVNGLPVLPGDGWVMEPKLDGNRLIGHVTADGQVDLYGGRNGTPWGQSALDGIRDVLAASCPPDTIIDGELMVPMTHARSSDVTHAVASGEHLEVWLFDLLRLDGQDVMHMDWSARRLLLAKLFSETGALVKITPVSTPNWELAQEWVKLGIEGIVCKRKDGRYQPGKRSHDMLKWKPQETLEGRITGFVEGKNGIAGTIGALELEIEGSGVKTTVSCPPELSEQILRENGLIRFDDAIHAHNDWIGRCLEFKHYGLFPSGSPRHPGFLRMRPDRD